MDRVGLQVHRHRLEGIAEEMGNVLQRTAFSPNIKERRDFSCALTDAKGRLLAQAAHIPVHLGAISTTVRAFLEEVDVNPRFGYLLNDPYRGGTHLPDLSYIEPWTLDGRVRGYVINRAHHTDIGGSEAGSMAVSRHIDREGFRTGPRSVVRGGRLLRQKVADLLEISRTPEERITDLEAQVAAARRGCRRLTEWSGELDSPPEEVYRGLREYSRRFTRRVLESWPNRTVRARDRMDDDGVTDSPVPLRVTLTLDDGAMTVDYRRVADQVDGNINCPRAVTTSATYYVLQCLLEEDIPVNEGIFEPVEILTRPGSLLEVEHPGGVAGGNVETSQRVVDLLLKAFAEVLPGAIPAASQGTMNNVTFGCRVDGEHRSYYETLGGGSGGHPNGPGLSARQVHMTNTQNTPIEEFERSFPLRVEELSVRSGSGGDGENPGGDGLCKTWRALAPVQVSLLTDRRRTVPYGLHGGEPGEPGVNRLLTGEGPRELSPKTTLNLQTGEALHLETPGGGGWSAPTL